MKKLQSAALLLDFWLGQGVRTAAIPAAVLPMLCIACGVPSAQHLEDYLNEFVFRFNRRKSASRELFYRIAQQAAQIAPTTYEKLVRPQALVHG